MNDVNGQCSYAQFIRCYEQLKVMDDMKYSMLCKGFKCYEQLRVVDDMNYSGTSSQGAKYSKQLSIVEDMKNLTSFA